MRATITFIPVLLFYTLVYPLEKQTTFEKAFGNIIIRIVQIDKDNYGCDAELTILKNGEVLSTKRFNRIESLGGHSGLFIPNDQPSENFFIINKLGDYDGRTLIIDKEGNIIDLPGGSIFSAPNKEHLLFIIYSQDCCFDFRIFNLNTCKVEFTLLNKDALLIDSNYYSNIDFYDIQGEVFIRLKYETKTGIKYFTYKYDYLDCKLIAQNKVNLSYIKKIETDDLGYQVNNCSCEYMREFKEIYSPYHDCYKYDPHQIDFRKEFQAYIYDYCKDLIDITDSLRDLDARNLFLENIDSIPKEGVIGNNYQKIEIKILTVNKSKENPFEYDVTGKSRVKDNICNFKGTIKLQNAFLYKENSGYKKNTGVISATYKFFEDIKDKHSGAFGGIIETFFILDGKRLKVDESFIKDEFYTNNTFVGVWEDYGSELLKKCIWGDFKLPFTFDFDIGVMEREISSEYYQNGWEKESLNVVYVVGYIHKEIKKMWWK